MDWIWKCPTACTQWTKQSDFTWSQWSDWSGGQIEWKEMRWETGRCWVVALKITADSSIIWVSGENWAGEVGSDHHQFPQSIHINTSTPLISQVKKIMGREDKKCEIFFAPLLNFLIFLPPTLRSLYHCISVKWHGIDANMLDYCLSSKLKGKQYQHRHHNKYFENAKDAMWTFAVIFAMKQFESVKRNRNGLANWLQ